jgi:hypothetical protein
MIDSRLTLSKLHSKFPNLTLDNLFEILDCYTEVVTYDWSKWPHTFDKPNTWPLTNINYGNPTCTATANLEVPQKCD